MTNGRMEACLLGCLFRGVAAAASTQEYPSRPVPSS